VILVSDSSGFKIFVAGPYHAGKTTIVHFLDKNSMSVEKIMPDGTKSTVVFDLGHVWWDQGDKILTDEEIKGNPCNAFRVVLMGSPGQVHMTPVREATSKGAKGVLFVVDSTAPGQIGHAMAIYEEIKMFLGKDVPMVIIANKHDVPGAMKADDLRNLLKAEAVKFVEGSGLTGQGVKEALIELLRVMKEKGCFGT
jgi:small GTP-binding protein